MIRPKQLAQALDRLHPRDRELLSLSLRRRVPDEALGRIYDCDASEVARQRARAIERLADEMELQRGEDLGAVLKALLEPDTWSAAAASLGEEFATGGGGARLAAVPLPDKLDEPDGAGDQDEPDEPDEPRVPALAPVPPPPAEDGAGDQDRPARAGDPPEEHAPAADAEPASDADRTSDDDPQAIPVDAEPVLEMLAGRKREAPDPPRRAVPLALVGLGIAALVAAAGVIGATQFGGSGRILKGGGGDNGTRSFTPEKGGALAAPFPSDPRTASCYSTASIPKAATLYREPGGRRRVRITPRTEWGSARVLGVVDQRDGWLAVQAAELRNGEIAWIRRGEARLDCVRWSLHTDLSRRVLYVREDGNTVRKFRVAIGRRENPTPQGRFTVTDKLRVTGSSSPYGCCVLALTGHQTNLPPYWPGGDRLAIHATDNESSIGNPVSLGCLRAQSREARWLINNIPLGAPVFISA